MTVTVKISNITWFTKNNIHLPQIPIVNYAGDVEHEEDFGNGWEWTEKIQGHLVDCLSVSQDYS